MYGKDVKMDLLQMQLSILCGSFRKFKKVSIISTIVDTLAGDEENSLGRTMCSEVIKVLRIYLTFPLTSSSAERSFSALKRLKSPERNAMTQEHLNHFLVCHVHKERLSVLNMNDIAQNIRRS